MDRNIDINIDLEGSLMELQIPDLLDDDENPQHFKTAFKQQTMIGWNNFSWERWREDRDNASQKNLLDIEHSVYIDGMGQSMLKAPQLHTVQRTTRQIQDDEIMVNDRGMCVDGSTHSRETDPTTMQPVEAETF